MNPISCEDSTPSCASGNLPSAMEVTLADGSRLDISNLSHKELERLQWEQDRDYAAGILSAPKGSTQRAQAVQQAYENIPRIFEQMQAAGGEDDSLGMDSRYAVLVAKLLARQESRNIKPSFFEIGFGSGALLKAVTDLGYAVAGIEASQCLRDQAVALLGPEYDRQLLVSDFLAHEPDPEKDPYTLIYWNDVFEHIPPDEIRDYVRKTYELLAPGGSLATITPNWHLRPSDATAIHHPPRTEARGLHLKEYTLAEVTALLKQAGFERVEVPLCFTRKNIFLAGNGFARSKRFLEPTLEWMPFRLAQILCRGLGLNCTIATKKQS